MGMRNEPKPDEETDGQQDGQDGQPVALAPPESQEEADAEDDAGDLGGVDVEAGEDEQGADERGAEVAGGQGDGVPAADHARLAALARVEGDADDLAAGADGGEGVAELVEGDDEHLEGPEDVAHDGDVPQNGDGDDVGGDDGEGDALGVVGGQVAAGVRVVDVVVVLVVLVVREYSCCC